MWNKTVLKDRNILVTGATGGIGRAIAVACAERGARLLVCGRKAGAMDALAAELSAVGAAAVWARALDVRDRAAVAAWFAQPKTPNFPDAPRTGADLAEQPQSALGAGAAPLAAAKRDTTASTMPLIWVGSRFILGKGVMWFRACLGGLGKCKPLNRREPLSALIY